MSADLAFLIGLLEDATPTTVAWEDFVHSHGEALAVWQRMGFLEPEPGMHPVPSCPHCFEGEPCRLGQRYLCNRCLSGVDPRHLQLWPVRIDAFFSWLARELELSGGVRLVGEHLWQLGTGEREGIRFEWFFQRPGTLTDAELSRLSAYRNALVIYGLTRPDSGTDLRRCFSLLEILELGRALTVAKIPLSRQSGRRVRFDVDSGAMWAGNSMLGEVSVGSKEHAFLRCLAAHLDTFVPYPDIKHFVLQQSGSADTTEEATFCQLLKSRIKKKWVPELDRLIVTTNKADGYRMRAVIEAL